jgi:hypothetical protein
MHRCKVTGLDVVADEAVPDGQIWLDAPGPNGEVIRYVLDIGTMTELDPEAKRVLYANKRALYSR